MAKKAKTAPDGVVDIFSVLAEGDEDTQEQEQQPKPEADPALVERIGAMEAELRRLERTNAALMANSQTYAPAMGDHQTKAPAEADFSNLPDPVTDAENYHKEVAKRITVHLKAQGDADRAAQAAQQEAQASRNAQVANLWAEFEEKYPDLAEYKDMAEFAAISVANRQRAKGVDVQRYMFQASEQYIEDVAAEMKKRFGKALEVMGKEDAETDTDTDAPAEGTIAAAMVQARTRGITGGIPGSGKAPKAEPEGGDDDSFLKDLQKTQKAMGII